jgi:hypothetical protein
MPRYRLFDSFWECVGRYALSGLVDGMDIIFRVDLIRSGGLDYRNEGCPCLLCVCVECIGGVNCTRLNNLLVLTLAPWIIR